MICPDTPCRRGEVKALRFHIDLNTFAEGTLHGGRVPLAEVFASV